LRLAPVLNTSLTIFAQGAYAVTLGASRAVWAVEKASVGETLRLALCESTTSP
jgi:hypothetical protein